MPSHPAILETRQIRWPDEAACAAFAGQLSRLPALREACLELEGGLGAGKTTFTRHLLQALGVQGRIKSPTYAVVETYELPGPPALDIAHFDFYRFEDPAEWEDAGLREIYARPGLRVVEWAVKASPLLPAPDLRLRIDGAGGEGRDVRLEAHTARGIGLLRALIPEDRA